MAVNGKARKAPFTPEINRRLNLRSAQFLKLEWMEKPTENFATLCFAELSIGDHFITLPVPGDNEGHGGLRQSHRLYVKVNRECARRFRDDFEVGFEKSLRVVKVEVG